jgi:hypothetical protein
MWELHIVLGKIIIVMRILFIVLQYVSSQLSD